MVARRNADYVLPGLLNRTLHEKLLFDIKLYMQNVFIIFDYRELLEVQSFFFFAIHPYKIRSESCVKLLRITSTLIQKHRELVSRVFFFL